MSTEGLKRIKAEAGKAVLRATYSLDVEDSLNHLSEVNAFLSGGGNLLLYGNHIAYTDPLIATLFYTRYIDPQRKRHVLIPASHWHTDLRNNKPFFAASKALEYVFNAEIFRLIQSYMVDNPEFGSYTAQDADINHMAFFKRLRELRRANIPTTLLIYPEGHRSINEELQKAEDGFVLAGSIMKPTAYLPIGLSYQSAFSRESLNSRIQGSHAHISVGQPYFLTEDKKRPSADLLMNNLAACLPPEMWGVYK